ncbi:MAG: S8 family serine peptidase [Polyangiaceae bacterium]
MRASFGVPSLGIILAMAAACSAHGGGSSSPPAPAPAPASMPEHPMIVLLRDSLPHFAIERGTMRMRATAIAASHAPLVAELQATKARPVHSFETINGFATTMSQDEIAAFTAKPEVLAVVPDRAIPKPKRPHLPAPIALRGAGSSGSTTNTAALCNTLEPEALQITNTAFLDPTTPQAQTVLDGRGQPVTGKGVTVAVIADGLDPTIPGFTRPDGSKVFVDYQNFTGDPAGTPTYGGEIFGDASSVAAQDMPNGQPLLYDISQFAYNTSLPTPCNIRIRGLAPGASLVGIDIFSYLNYAPLSIAVQAVEWAVVHDQVDVINESFGTNIVADAGTDPLGLANAAAVAAGVTLTVASGDAGSAGTFGAPATDPSVIAAGASTQFRFYAQAGFGPISLATGYVGDNVSSFSSGGFAELEPRMVDLLAPGDLSWALCSTNTTLFEDCTSFNGQPSPIEFFGGTSEAAPVTAGAAALVIQAYRSTHGGVSPSPAQVKAILTSSATDLGAPASEEGAGRIDSLAAVRAALSVESAFATPQAAQITAQVGSSQQSTFQITNTGTAPLRVQPALERLGAPIAGQTLALDLDPTAPLPYIEQTFTVPAGADHLDASIAFTPYQYEQLGLIDPQGRLAAYSFPQGAGSYGSVDVGRPAAGTWTAVVYGGTGPLELTWAAEKYVPLGTVSPANVTLPPGASTQVTATFQVPDQPGDLSAALRFPGTTLAEIPVGVRILVPTGPRGGSFQGTLTGGNGRPGAIPTQTFELDVPPGVNDLALTLTVPDSAISLTGFLVDPNGAVLDSASNAAPLAEGESALELLRSAPQAGAWRLILQENQASGSETSIQFTANVAFNTAKASAPALPTSAHSVVSAAKGAKVALSVTNTGSVTKAYFADPRLSSLTTLTLPTQPGCGPTLPGFCGVTVLPPRAVAAEFQAQAAGIPFTLDASPITDQGGYTEDPDVWGFPVGNGTVAAFAQLPELPYGLWLINPANVGNFGAAGAPATAITASTTVIVQAFDASITPSTGDYWADQALGTTTSQPLVLAPGATGTITLAIQPPAKSVGQTVRGSVYVDTVNPADVWATGV